MIEILMYRGKMNRLAHSGEKNAVRAVFDLEPFQRTFPGGTPLLLVRRRGDREGYPVNLEADGGRAYWLLSSADTASPGVGQCELQWTVGETLVKSDKYDFLVLEALPAGTQPPDDASQRWFEAIQSQIGDLRDLTTKATENLVAAINEAAKTGSGGSGDIDMQVADGYIQYSTDGDKTWKNLIAIADLKGDKGDKGDTGATGPQGETGPQGPKGDPGHDGSNGQDGYSPTATVSKSGKVTTITITDKNGTTTAAVEDGEDGAPGAKGDAGATPNIQIGTVTTLDAGADATASMSGTPENPLLNLGIPKGADGGSDRSLGLTGATVGQIAKVTAVDESGKPTAWSPVDMPSGGGSGTGGSNKIVLADFTLAEDITNYGSVTIPLSQNPFEFSQILIVIKSQLADDSGQYAGSLHGGGKQAKVFHLNTLFSKTAETTFAISASLFVNYFCSTAVKMVDYMWNSTKFWGWADNLTSIDSDAAQLKISNMSALAGMTVRVEGVK